MKISFIRFGIVAAMFVLVLGVLAPSVSRAQSVSDLQAQIQSLLRQVEALKAQLAATQNGSAIPAFCHSFDKRNFGVGASGNDVSALVTILAKEGVMDERGSNFAREFDESLASAVSAFQEKYRSEILDPVGLKNGTGYVGRATRAKLNALYGCSGGSSSDMVKKLQPIMPKKPATPATDAMMNVIAPNGGETLHKGTTYAITWHSPAPAASVNISLVPYSAPCTASPCPVAPYYAPYTIHNSLPNNGVYNWSVGAVAGGGSNTAPDGAYTMRICRTVPETDRAGLGQMVCDESDSYFKITSTSGGGDSNTAPIINSATAPSSGIQPGQSVNFSWGAIDPDNDDLSWSVDWGDGSGIAGSCQVPPPQQSGANRTFSANHAWVNAGTYYAKVTVIDCWGGTGTYSFTVVVGSSTPPPSLQPSITMYGVSGNQKSNSSISVNVGNTFTISGIPQNLQGLSYWSGTGYPPSGYYNMAYFFDQKFGNNNMCGNNAASTSGVWTMTCSAKVPGSSAFYVEIYANGQIYRSNSVYVTIPSTPSSNQPPVVTGVSGPTTLSVNQVGTWTVGAYDPEGGMLSYSVDWGDSAVGIMPQTIGSAVPSQTATFTHSYAQAGSYTVKFTVTDSGGLSAESSITAAVGSTASSPAMLSPSIDPSTPPARQLAMGTSGNVLAVYRLTETSNIEGAKVTNITISDFVSPAGAKASFQNLSFYSAAGVYLGTALVPTVVSGGYSYQFSFSSPVIVPQGGSITLTLKGDVGTYSSSSTTSNSSHVFGLTGAVAVGATSGSQAGFNLGANLNGNPMTVLRTVLTAAATPLGVVSGRSKSSADDIGTLTFKADPAGALALNVVTVTFAGTAPAHPAFLDGVNLYDPSTGTNIGMVNTTSSVCSGSNTCTKTFNLGAGVMGYVIGGGSSKTFNVRINSTKTFSAPSGVSATLSATINAPTDVLYTDALDGLGTSNIPLPSSAVPIPINSVNFAQGT